MSATRTFDPDPNADRTRDHERADATAGYPGVPPTPAPVSSPPGYEIVGELGRGGMGVVYDAVQTTINRPCALKMVLGSGHAGSVALVRFLAEAEAVAAIDHPHVVRVFEFGNHGGQPFLAMERLDGGSLADRLKATGPLPVAEAVTLLEKIAAGVQAGHDLGIVHRDLKPANILLAADGTPKVTDFGLAKRDSGSDLTSTQAMMGTPDYMSPEQAQGRTKFVGPTADVYALGAILFAALAGRPPFKADNLLDLRLKVIGEDPPALTKLVPGLPRDLAVIAAKCLAKAPADRYPTAAAFAEDLRRWRTGETIVARAASNQERAWKSMKRNRGLVTAAGVVVLALCVGMAATSVAAVRALAEAKRADGEAAKAVEAAERADGETTKARAETDRAEKQLDRAERLVYASQIAKTDSELWAGDYESATRFFQRTRWDFRGWEHDYLTTRFLAGHAKIGQHTKWVKSVAFTQNGRGVVTSDEDNKRRYWDSDTGSELIPSTRDIESLVSPVYTHNRRTALGSTDMTVKLCDATTGSVLLTLTGHTAAVKDVVFSPDGSRVVSTSDDTTLRLWDATTGRELRVLAGHTAPVTCVAFSSDGTRIVSAGKDKTVRIWDVSDDVNRVATKHTATIRCAAISPDGTRVVSSGRDKVVKIQDIATGRVVCTLVGHESIVQSAVFSPNGSRVLTSSDDKAVRLWEATTGQELFVMKGHTDSVNCAAFNHDGTRIASSSRDTTVRLWDADSGRELRTLAGHTASVNCATFSPDGTHIVSASDDETIKLWDAAGKDLFTLPGHTSRINTVTFSNDSKLVVSASNDKTIKRWNVATGEELGSFGGHKSEVASAVYSQDGTRLLTSCSNRTAKLWDAMTGQELLNFDYSSRKSNLQFVVYNPTGQGIAGFDTDESIISLYKTLPDSDSVIARGSGRVLTSFSILKEGSVIVGKTNTGIEDAKLLVDMKLLTLIQFDELPRVSDPTAIPLAPTAPGAPYSVAPTQGSTSALSVNNDSGISGIVDIGDTQVWSLTTGQLIRNQPIPAGLTFVTRADLPDGKRVAFIEGGKIVVRDKAKYAAFQAEMARRLAEYARPKPDWHAKSFDEAVAAKDGFAARFHLGYLRKIKGDADPAVTSRVPLLPKEVAPKPGS